MLVPVPSATTSISARCSRELGVRVRRIGIDVGGTNTDAALMRGRAVHATCKTPTTPDVTTGIVTAVRQILATGQVAPADVSGAR